MTYTAWRKLAAALRGEIATCDGCVFRRRRIELCGTHGSDREDQGQ